MQTLTHVKMINSSVRISHSAAAIFANGLALSNSLVRLEIQEPCWFEPGAALKLVEGIKRNKSLEDLTVAEVNMGKVAMISLLRALAEGQHPKLVTLNINLKLESDCATFVTKLMSSDACHVKDLTVDANRYSPNMFRTDGIQMGKPNMKLKSLHVSFPLLEESYLTMLLPMMAGLLHLRLRFCEITDLSPVIDHLCGPNTSIKSIDLRHNKMGIDQVEKFVGSLADMHSLTDVDFTKNTWSYDRSVDEERVKNIVQKVSNCFNLEKFVTRGERGWKQDVKNLNLNLAINRAWRRELCYNNASPPSKLLPFIITRALRKTERDRHGDVVLALLRERMSDLIPVPPSDQNSQRALLTLQENIGSAYTRSWRS